MASLSVVRGQYDFRTGDLPRWARVLEPAKLPSPAPTDGVEDLLKAVSSRIQGDYVLRQSRTMLRGVLTRQYFSSISLARPQPKPVVQLKSAERRAGPVELE